uniref:Aspergillus nuclease S1 n=1 Tax=Oryza sativa subsp. japonica TaxID=39947 RepID=Q7XND5_ORYSJ|nr:OSJNBb0034I13.4 [Oryza sativa Japonica Group]
MASDKCSSFLLAAAAAAVLVLASAPVAHSWSKEGHMLTCRIAQDLLEPAAAHAVRNLLTEEADGDLSALCVWPDQVRHWYKYRWTSPLHFIDTLTKPAASSTQGIAMARMVRRIYNMTEALLFLSHFMGDVHQVWDREMILTAIAEFYGKDMDAFQKDLVHNFTTGTWSDDVSSWGDCEDLLSCSTKYATESINLACKWAYNDVREGETLSDDYFGSRLPIVTRRIAQGGVRLAMFLNRLFGEHNRDVASPA